MKKTKQYRTQFVDVIPHRLDEGVLYVCIRYDIVAHLCACGCGEEIYTPISKKYGWVIQYDGQDVSLSPSIGNGEYACHSHYFVKNGIIEWLPPLRNSQTENVKTNRMCLFDKLTKLFEKYRK